MLSKMAQFVIYAHDILGWRVDDEGFVERPCGRIVPARVQSHPGYSSYLVVSIRNRRTGEGYIIRIHKLTAYQKYGIRAFDDRVVTRHRNGNSLDNRPSNILIGSQYENIMDMPASLRVANSMASVRNNRALTYEQARHIFETQPETRWIMDTYGVSKQTARLIKIGASYQRR